MKGDLTQSLLSKTEQRESLIGGSSTQTEVGLSRISEFEEIGKILRLIEVDNVDLFYCLTNRCRTLKGHTGSITLLALSTDGKLLASASEDKNIKIWSTQDRKELFTLTGHSAAIGSISFNQTGSLLASASDDNLVKIWNISSQKEEASLEGHTGPVNTVSFSVDGKIIASGSNDKSIKFWNVTTHKEEFALNGHLGAVCCLAFSPDKKLLASGSNDRTIKVWSLADKNEFTLKGHTSFVFCLAFSPDSKILTSSSDDKSIRVWNIALKREEFTFLGHSAYVRTLSYSADGRYLASGSGDKLIKIWSVAERKELFTLKGHSSFVYTVKFSANGKTLYSGSSDKTIKIWDLSEPMEEFTLKGHLAPPRSVKVSPDGRFIASGSDDKKVKIWNIQEKKEEASLDFHKLAVRSVAFSHDGRLLACGSGDKSISIYNFSDKNQEATLNGHLDSVSCVCFSPTGLYLASSSADKLIKVWDITAKSEFRSMIGHTAYVTSVYYSPDGNFLASSSGDKTIRYWNITDNSEVFKLLAHSAEVSTVAISPSGKFIVSGSADFTVKLWNIAEQLEEFTIKNYSVPVTSVSFSLNGSFLACGLKNGSIRIYNIPEKREEFILNSHISPVTSVNFGINDCLVSSSEDTSIKYWDLSLIQLPSSHFSGAESSVSTYNGEYSLIVEEKTIKLLHSVGTQQAESILEADGSLIRLTCFSIDSLFLAAATEDNSIVIWNLYTKQVEYSLKTDSLVEAMMFSPNSQVLVCKTVNQEFKLWNLLDQTLKLTLNEPGTNLSFTINSELILPDLSKGFKVFNQEGKPVEAKKFRVADSIFFKSFASLARLKFRNAYIQNNVLFMLANTRYSEIAEWDCFLSIFNFTPVHLAAYKGSLQMLEKAFSNPNTNFYADNFGRSPLYYSITRKHQTSTDFLLAELVKKFEIADLATCLSNFNSVRNDLSLIIRNSSVNLCDFLSCCLFSKNELKFGECIIQRKFMDGVSNSFTSFIAENEQEPEPLRIKISCFELPSIIGSASSISLFTSFLACGEKDIYKVQMVRSIIQQRWEALKLIIVIYSLLLWINLILMVLMFGDAFGHILLYTISLITLNILFIIWELLELTAKGREYLDYWNTLDIFRTVLTIGWASCYFVNFHTEWLNWAVALLNILRGVTGFRAFDQTRYYIRLILESLAKSASFLLIFVYTTLSFGLLTVVSEGENFEINFQTLWINSFVLAVGDIEKMKSDYLGIKYISFLMAVILNVILMLNMIISILGDSFDEFQMQAVYYDSREMTEVIVEIESIYSLFKPIEEKLYLHLCENYYSINEDNWGGKVVDLRNYIKEVSADIIKNNNEKNELIQERFNDLAQESKEQKKVEAFKSEARIKELEDRIAGLDVKFQKIDSKIDENMNLVQSKFDRILTILESKDN